MKHFIRTYSRAVLAKNRAVLTYKRVSKYELGEISA